MLKKYLLILGFSICVILSFAQDMKYTLSDDSLVNYYASFKRVYYATRTEIKPKIDGKLDDECWNSVGTWDGDFVQQQPHQAKKPSQETEIKILYDDNYLYFAIKCYDNEPEKISPILGRRDAMHGDIAGIALDSYKDNRTAFEFNVTAAGQKVDLMHLGDYNWDFNWDAVWDGKASVGDSAWYAEMRVPFTQLRFANNEEQIWGMHIWRWINRLSEESQWKLIPVDAPAMVYIFGELRGIKDIPYKRNFEVLPYAKTKYISDAHEKYKYGFGLDGKISVTSNFTLDYTFNPDFGQVEADPSELNLTSYEVFYDEKRPFFLEGNSILDYNVGSDLLFYSRRIGHAPSFEPGYSEGINAISTPDNTSILNALKLTGKNKKGLSLGIINSMTARENATLHTENGTTETAVEPFTNYFIGRIKQDLNNGNTVLGGMLTSTVRNIKDEQLEFLPEKSIVGGFDFQHNWKNRKYFVDFKSFYSKIDGSTDAISQLQLNSRHYYQRTDADHLNYNPDLKTLDGWGGELSGGKRSGKFRMSGTLDWRSPGVELNDLGYMKQADFINQQINILYWVNKPKGILLSYYVELTQKHFWSYGGENIGDGINFHSRLQFKNRWRWDAYIKRDFNIVDTRQLRGGPSLLIDNSSSVQFVLNTDPGKNLIFAFNGFIKRFDDNITNRNTCSFYLNWKISNRVTVISQTSYSEESDNNQYISQKSIAGTSQYFVGKLGRKTLYTTLRAELFVTPELSLQYYGSPYASIGKFMDFKRVENADSKNLSDRFKTLTVTEMNGNNYVVDENNNPVLNLTTSNPDFNFQEFRSNFVLRWEYKTGSTFYFVWTNNRSHYENEYNPSIGNSLKGISKVAAQNAFMLKLSYWFSL
jgi:hypothetical protein